MYDDGCFYRDKPLPLSSTQNPSSKMNSNSLKFHQKVCVKVVCECQDGAVLLASEEEQNISGIGSSNDDSYRNANLTPAVLLDEAAAKSRAITDSAIRVATIECK